MFMHTWAKAGCRCAKEIVTWLARCWSLARHGRVLMPEEQHERVPIPTELVRFRNRLQERA